MGNALASALLLMTASSCQLVFPISDPSSSELPDGRSAADGAGPDGQADAVAAQDGAGPDGRPMDGGGIGQDAISGADSDGDGQVNQLDNCPFLPNPRQHNEDGDPWGDECDPCPHLPAAAAHPDTDSDGIGDACDPTPAQGSTRYWFGFNDQLDPSELSADQLSVGGTSAALLQVSNGRLIVAATGASDTFVDMLCSQASVAAARMGFMPDANAVGVSGAGVVSAISQARTGGGLAGWPLIVNPSGFALVVSDSVYPFNVGLDQAPHAITMRLMNGQLDAILDGVNQSAAVSSLFQYCGVRVKGGTATLDYLFIAVTDVAVSGPAAGLSR